MEETKLEVKTVITSAFAEIDGKLPCPLCEEKYETSSEGEINLRKHLEEIHKVIV